MGKHEHEMINAFGGEEYEKEMAKSIEGRSMRESNCAQGVSWKCKKKDQ